MQEDTINEGTALIPLTRGKEAIVDQSDFVLLNKHKWCADKIGRVWYAAAFPAGKKIHMHRMLLPGVKEIDHINRNGLDNRRANLRAATSSQNRCNSPSRGGSSVFKGVSWAKSRNVWRASIRANGHSFHIGHFTDEEDAARAYDKAAQLYFGEFAYLNFPDEQSINEAPEGTVAALAEWSTTLGAAYGLKLVEDECRDMYLAVEAALNEIATSRQRIKELMRINQELEQCLAARSGKEKP